MASSAREQLFRKRTPSKYEEKGKDFRTYLNEMLRDKDYRYFYEYQMRAVMSTERFLLIDEAETQSVKRIESEAVLIVAPTGSGKSGMIMLLPYVLQSRKVLLLTPSIIISKQLARTFGIFKKEESFFQVTGFCKKENSDECDDEGLENLLETGMIITDANQIHSRLPNLVIVNAQKFGGKSRLSLEYDNREIVDDVGSFFSQFDTLIVDEAHHYPAKTWLKIVQEFKKPAPGMQKQIIFITATPYRSISGGNPKPILANQKQRIAYEIKREDVEGKTIRRQEFTDSGKRSELALDILRLLEQNRRLEPRINHQAIVLVTRTDEADQIAEELNTDMAVDDDDFAVAIASNSPKKIVQERMAAFSEGKHRVAVQCMLLNEGYDNSSVTVGVILRNVRSKILFEQFIGRCMRMKKFKEGEPDKSVAFILSYKQFKQRKLWMERNALAKEDPIDEGLPDDGDFEITPYL